METWIVDWNILVSPEFALHHGVDFSDRELHIGKGDTREIVKRYNRECVTQLIDEYEDLTGLGISVGERMENISAVDRETWIEEAVIAGIRAARRPIKFMHRAPFTADPQPLRRVLAGFKTAEPPLVEFKFNWSHGHSSPRLCMTHDVGGNRSVKQKLDDGYWSPPPTDYRMVWMVRNEDFFILRWGNPDFVREHVLGNRHEWVAGYIVGSEGYIPAKDYSHRLPHRHVSWNYAFQKQWLFYAVWGALLFNPGTSDEILARGFEERYGKDLAADLLRAFSLGSRMPHRLASFHAATWDYSLYSEGFLAPFPSLGLFDGKSALISIDELIDHPTLDPRLLSIPEFVGGEAGGASGGDSGAEAGTVAGTGKTTPLQLATESIADSEELFSLIAILQKASPADPAYHCELADLKAWAHLGRYFGLKLKAGVSLHRFRLRRDPKDKDEARDHIGKAIVEWERLVEVTDAHYQEVPYIERREENFELNFSWKRFLEAARADLTAVEEAR